MNPIYLNHYISAYLRDGELIRSLIDTASLNLFLKLIIDNKYIQEIKYHWTLYSYSNIIYVAALLRYS